jgi:lysophospholipase L1-like esterase
MPGAICARELVIVAFGDSTTAPRDEDGVVVYETLLAQALAAKRIPVKVINAGKPSNTTSDARARFEKDVFVHNPDLVIIQFGINDAAVDVWKNPPATQPRVSRSQYEANLRYMVKTLTERGAHVVLMTPNACRWTETTRKYYAKPPYRANDPDGFNIVLSDYAGIVRRVARQEGVPVVDVFAAFQAYGKVAGQSVDGLLVDGMHPNSKGHKLIANLLLSSKAIDNEPHDEPSAISESSRSQTAPAN